MGRQCGKRRTKKSLELAVEVSALGLSCYNCNEALKKFRGCNGKPVQPFLHDGQPLDRCPAKIIPPEVKDYIRYYAYYKKGHLPFKGGIADQPKILIEIFDILESAEIEHLRKKGNI